MNTTPESRLLELYDRVAEAPDAIERLRKFVLDLAVRGKLVEQDPENEPAEELLKQIATEKTRLVKTGEIRKPRDLADGNEIEEPFEIPSTWRWCRLDTIGAIIGGGTPAAADAENFAEPGEGIPWLTPADLGGYHDLYIERGKRDLTEKGLKSSSATMMPVGTVLFTSRAPIGYVAIAANPISTNQGFKSIVPYVADCSRFIPVAMQTFAPEIDAKAPGTTFKEVSGKIVAGVSFPLPPLPEQHRIVAKVDELMTVLDRLETTRTQRETIRDRLTTASLTRLTAPETSEKEFPAHARFALDNLDQLTNRPDQIKILRQTILNLAVRGKLVEQDPANEPAEELLKRIDRWRQTATEAKQIKPHRKPLKPISNDDHPYTLPGGWSWARLGRLIYIKSGDGLTSSNMREGSIPVYGGNGITGYHDEANTTEPTIVIGRVGYYCGSIHLTPSKAWITDNAFVTKYSQNDIHREFMQLLLLATNLKEQDSATAQPVISAAKIYPIVVGLPPLDEQHRIVTKVDALMALCDKLEAATITADATRARLLEVFLHDSLAQDAHSREAA